MLRVTSPVKAQICRPGFFVRTMALEALVRQDRPNMLTKADLVCG
jgi:hypothetical protein